MKCYVCGSSDVIMYDHIGYTFYSFMCNNCNKYNPNIIGSGRVFVDIPKHIPYKQIQKYKF